MFGNRFEAVNETIVGTASVVLGIVIAGRTLNSQTMLDLEERVPLLKYVTRPLRAVINQTYDPAGAE